MRVAASRGAGRSANRQQITPGGLVVEMALAVPAQEARFQVGRRGGAGRRQIQQITGDRLAGNPAAVTILSSQGSVAGLPRRRSVALAGVS